MKIIDSIVAFEPKVYADIEGPDTPEETSSWEDSVFVDAVDDLQAVKAPPGAYKEPMWEFFVDISEDWGDSLALQVFATKECMIEWGKRLFSINRYRGLEARALSEVFGVNLPTLPSDGFSQISNFSDFW